MTGPSGAESDKSRAVLKGERNVILREEQEVPKKSRQTRVAERSVERAKKNGFDISANDEPLWQALRTARTAIAKQQGVPPYVIFHDATLLEILRIKPHSLGELAKITGIGATKLERYGAKIISVMTDFTSISG